MLGEKIIGLGEYSLWLCVSMWESFDFSLIVIKQRKNIREIEEKSVSLHSLSKTKYRRFLPLVKKEGALAQVVEQWTENPCVLGSTPRGTTPPFILPGFPVMEFGPFFITKSPSRLLAK